MGVKEEVASEESDMAIPNPPAPGITVATETLKLDDIVNDAYLRTLSRFPTADEMQTSQAYIKAEADPVDGIRSVLWALLNTREFMVNH